MMRQLTRDDLSRRLAAFGAFTSSGKMMDGNDRTMLAHLRKLRRKLKDERGEAIERVIRDLTAIMKAEKATRPRAAAKVHR